MPHTGKMTPEKARALRDEERGHARHPLFDPHPGDAKTREIRFDQARPEQLAQAQLMLGTLDGLTVSPGQHSNGLTISYDIRQYTLQGLETALIREGFHLDNSVLHQMARAVIYFCEDTQIRNLQQPERLIKQSQEIYSKAWDHHPHGDKDETPLELRAEK